MDLSTGRRARPGGAFLVHPETGDVFAPEQLNDEQRMARRAAADFVAREIVPRFDEIEHQNWDVHRALLRKLGGLGFLAPDLAEDYGGGGADSLTSLVLTEALSLGSFAVTYTAHVGIGMLPIAFFGTEPQRRRYLPPMARGDLVGAYALTEPTAGSDALSIRTRAVRSQDGGAYLLSGQKQFITNAGIADVFVVFAKVDGEAFTAFIVDRETPGLEIGGEEQKMGVKGSSTRSLFFEQARVPADRLLGEVGKGHRVAFNILNLGRFKLGASCVGSAKHALQQATAYALERKQFGRPIAEFGLVRQKLAQMAARLYAAESMVYRTGGLVDGAVGAIRGSDSVIGALEEYAIESSINKVFASEMLDRMVDQMVQIYGGNGYLEQYPAARAYRAARINRIWEGTSEINRLLIVDMLLKRGARGRLDLTAAVDRVRAQPQRPGPPAHAGPLAAERTAVDALKSSALFCLGEAVRRHGDRLEAQQEVLAAIADLVAEAYAVESAVLRAAEAARRGDGKADALWTLARAYAWAAVPAAEAGTRYVLGALGDGGLVHDGTARLRSCLDAAPANLLALAREAAGRIIGAAGYPV